MSLRSQVTAIIPPILCFGNAVYDLKIYDCLLDVTLCVLKDITSINELWQHYNEK